MPKIVLPILLILHSFIAAANEAFLVWHSGSLCVTSSHENIAMESEDVSVIFGENDYTVDGTFIFTNSGEDTTVTMGFPMAFGTGIIDDELFQYLGIPEQPKTWVSGLDVPFIPVSESIEYSYYGPERREVLEKELKGKEEIEEFRNQIKSSDYLKNIVQVGGVTWYSKEVFFKKNETMVTRVQYKSNYGVGGYNLLSANYIYGSGKTWKGNIGKATFRIQTSPKIWMINYPNISHSHKWLREGEYEYVLTLENFEPADEDRLDFDVTSTAIPYLVEGYFFWPPETDSDFIETLTVCNEKQLIELKDTILNYMKRTDTPLTDDISERIRLAERFLEYNKKMNYRYEIDPNRIVEEIKEIQVETTQ